MNFTPFPQLVTDRLILREITYADCEEILFLRSDKETNKYIKRVPPTSIKDAEDFLAKITKGMQEGKNINWGLTLKGTTQMIGSICLWNFSEDMKVAEAGYDLNPAFHNQGFMTEALKAVLSYGFNDLAFEEIEAYTHYANEASKKLLAKNNFVLIEGKTDEDNNDNIVLGIRNPALVK